MCSILLSPVTENSKIHENISRVQIYFIDKNLQKGKKNVGGKLNPWQPFQDNHISKAVIKIFYIRITLLFNNWLHGA